VSILVCAIYSFSRQVIAKNIKRKTVFIEGIKFKGSSSTILYPNRNYFFCNNHLHLSGGKKVLLRVGGKDATEEFRKFHNFEAVMQKYGPQLFIGGICKVLNSEMLFIFLFLFFFFFFFFFVFFFFLFNFFKFFY
jgi:hypothetical protein